ncbi:MAG: GMC family oxidoreductase N-terminal domain-containing protein [Thermoleophilia bacterium]
MSAAPDVLVVGAGSAGCIVAARISQDPGCTVWLLEAGEPPADPRLADPLQWPFLEGAPFDWAYGTVPQGGTAGRVHTWPRGRVVGGSSQMHAMAHVRGHSSDFDAWAAATGDPGWGFTELLPHFLRCEDFSGGASEWHGAGGPMPVWLPDRLHPVGEAYMASALQAGHAPIGDHNGPRLDGVARNSLMIRDGRRVSVSDAYLEPVRDRPNLRVVTGTAVERLALQGDRVVGVQAIRDGHRERIDAGLTVLCTGAIGSPLTLMRSGIGPADDLTAHGIEVAHELPVGHNLHDHLLAAGNVYLSRRTVPPSRLQHSESLLYAMHGPGPAPEIVTTCVMLPAVSDAFPRPEVGTAFTIMFGVCHPRSRGRLRLGGPGIHDMPLLDPAYLTAPEDRAHFRAALRQARAVGGGAALAEWRDRELLPGPEVQDDDAVDAFIAHAAITHHHPVATCAMGADPATSVVDARLRVHGLDGVAVVDSSVIPRITTGPVHAAVMAIAERAAAELLAG